jgi:hypothetical protein
VADLRSGRLRGQAANAGMADGLGWCILCLKYSWLAVLKEEKTGFTHDEVITTRTTRRVTMMGIFATLVSC